MHKSRAAEGSFHLSISGADEHFRPRSPILHPISLKSQQWLAAVQYGSYHLQSTPSPKPVIRRSVKSSTAVAVQSHRLDTEHHKEEQPAQPKHVQPVETTSAPSQSVFKSADARKLQSQPSQRARQVPVHPQRSSAPQLSSAAQASSSVTRVNSKYAPSQSYIHQLEANLFVPGYHATEDTDNNRVAIESLPNDKAIKITESTTKGIHKCYLA